MFCIPAITDYLEKVIDTYFAGLATTSATFRLIADPGSDLDDRNFDWGGDIESYECNFHGYDPVTADIGGTGSAWKSLETSGLTVRTQQIEVTFTRNDGVPHSNTRTTATHIVYLGNDSGDQRIIKIWELPTPLDFNADGVTGTWKVRMFGLNDIDVV